MSRIQVTLDIEEADLELFQHQNGVLMPTKVLRIKKVVDGDDTYYQLQHARNQSAEMYAVPYDKEESGDYPELERSPVI